MRTHTARRHTARRTAGRTVPLAEPLEARRLLSASLVTLHGGTRMIRGSSHGENEVRVYRDPETNAVSVSVYAESAKAASVRSFAQTYDPAEITRVIVKGGRYDDPIQVGADDDALTVPVHVAGCAGRLHGRAAQPALRMPLRATAIRTKSSLR